MTAQPHDAPPHFTIEFVGGPFCGAVVDSRKAPPGEEAVLRLVAGAHPPADEAVRLRQPSPQLVRRAVEEGWSLAELTARMKYHHYDVLIDLGFAGHIWFRAVYAGVGG